jgi:hypothetical protein
VKSAAYVTGLPMSMRGGIWKATVAGESPAPGDENDVGMRFATPQYFVTLGIPLRLGRDLAESDARSAPFVAVVSESFVRRHWPGQDALGRTFTLANMERTVVGVVGDIRVRGLERASRRFTCRPRRWRIARSSATRRRSWSCAHREGSSR